ncbi:hypothetical protein LZK76_08530 [Rhizobium leguminosarum]|nr:hypothetical protein LZK76_08530 [Rhizobium leguminosarum]
MDGRRLREHHRRFVPGVDGFRHLQADEEPAAGGQDRGGINLFRRLGDETPALARIPFASFGLRSPPQGVGYLLVHRFVSRFKSSHPSFNEMNWPIHGA